MVGIGHDFKSGNMAKKIHGLDDKFWVWETLEEASRPSLHKLTIDNYLAFLSGWAVNIKGSEDLHYLLDEQAHVINN